MKTIAYLNWTAVCLSALTLNAAPSACADRSAAVGKQDKTYFGTVAAVDANEHILKVHGLFFSKAFDLGSKCSYSFLTGGSGDVSDLHAGQRVVVGFRNIDGARVADFVEQRPMVFEGTVKEIDAKKHTISVSHMGLEKTFRIAGSCSVELQDNKSGTLADIQPGTRITVTYETPKGDTVARRIAQDNQVFTGDLTAIDLNDRTAKAADMLSRKQFTLAPNCVIVINGKSGANLRDVKLGQRLEFDYVDEHGVNIVTRIENASESESRMTASSGSPHELPDGMPPSGY